MSGLITALSGLTGIGDKVTITLTKSGEGRFRVVVLNKLAEASATQDEASQKLRQGLAFPIVVEDTLATLEANLPAFLLKVCEDRLVLKDSFEVAKDNHREAVAGSMAAQKSTPKALASGPSKPQASGASAAPESQDSATPDTTPDNGLFGDSLI